MGRILDGGDPCIAGAGTPLFAAATTSVAVGKLLSAVAATAAAEEEDWTFAVGNVRRPRLQHSSAPWVAPKSRALPWQQPPRFAARVVLGLSVTLALDSAQPCLSQHCAGLMSSGLPQTGAQVSARMLPSRIAAIARGLTALRVRNAVNILLTAYTYMICDASSHNARLQNSPFIPPDLSSRQPS